MADSPTPPLKHGDRRVHLANERTFLAWIRTSISIMAFGFVVEKFSIFVKQMAFYMGKELVPPPKGYASVIGIILVGLGVVMGILAFVRYKTVERQIDEDSFQPSPLLNILLALAVMVVGLFLLFYLLHSL